MVGDLVMGMGLSQDGVRGMHYPLTGISVHVKFMRDERRTETGVGSLEILIPVIEGDQKMKARPARCRANFLDQVGDVPGARKTMKQSVHHHEIVASRSYGKSGRIVD